MIEVEFFVKYKERSFQIETYGCLQRTMLRYLLLQIIISIKCRQLQFIFNGIYLVCSWKTVHKMLTQFFNGAPEIFA